MFENLPDYLAIDDLAQKSTIWATNPVDGSQLALASFYDQDREEVPWDAVSQTVKDAAIAAEDPRFYEHGGVDLAGTIRGALVTLSGNDVQGGSSITQQYVKNVLINNGVSQATTEEEQEAAYEAATETTPERKLKEIRYAIALEKQYSKDEILPRLPEHRRLRRPCLRHPGRRAVLLRRQRERPHPHAGDEPPRDRQQPRQPASRPARQ
ncbi:transglycosylase domain-containing protein [Agromyces atrinae]|nr:biosynthetic peptidoglycan transglycosylase [Agromyces atrinae]MCI2959672.1 transglycosylase domain-containing protein [Agromyces atrinae]